MNSRPGRGRGRRQSRARRIGGRQQQQNLRLQRIGVLELVDENVGEALLETAPHGRRRSRTRSRALSRRSRKSSAPARCLELFISLDRGAELLLQSRGKIGVRGHSELSRWARRLSSAASTASRVTPGL